MADILPDRCWFGYGRIFPEEQGGISCYTNTITKLVMRKFSVTVDIGQNLVIQVDRNSAKKFFGQQSFDERQDIDKQIIEKILAKLSRLWRPPTLPLALEDFAKRLATNPGDFLQSKGREAYMTAIPSIGECHCCLQLSRPEDPSQDLRSKIERALVALIQQEFPSPLSRPLKICSIASGNCFQELVLHARLAQLGYRVDWILVDPSYIESPDKSSSTIQNFTYLAGILAPGSTVNVGYDVEDLLATKSYEPDVVLAIDADLDSTLVSIDSTSIDQSHKFFHAKQELFANTGPSEIYLSLMAKLYLGLRIFYQEKRIYANTRKYADPLSNALSIEGIVRLFDKRKNVSFQSPAIETRIVVCKEGFSGNF